MGCSQRCCRTSAGAGNASQRRERLGSLHPRVPTPHFRCRATFSLAITRDSETCVARKPYDTGNQQRQLVPNPQPEPARSRVGNEGAFVSRSLYAAQLPFSLFWLNAVRLQSGRRLQLVHAGLTHTSRHIFHRNI